MFLLMLQGLAAMSGTHKNAPFSRSRAMLGTINNVPRSRVMELQNPDEDKPLAPHYRVPHMKRNFSYKTFLFF